MKGSRQILNILNVRDGPSWGLYMAEFVQEDHSQEVSGVNDGWVMLQEGKEQRVGGGAEEDWPLNPSPSTFSGAGVQKMERSFYPKCPFSTCGVLVLSSEPFCKSFSSALKDTHCL